MWVTNSADRDDKSTRIRKKLVRQDGELVDPKKDPEASLEEAEVHTAEFDSDGKAQVKKAFGKWLVENFDGVSPRERVPDPDRSTS